VLLFGNEIRYCVEMKKWMVWDGRRWTNGETRRVRQMFKKTIREFYKQAADIADKHLGAAAERHARRSEGAASIRAALECTESEEGIAVSANALDTHPFLLNCQNGTLDLESGKLRAHAQHDLLTGMVRVNYRPQATCPRFLRFIHRIMGDNLDTEPGVGQIDWFPTSRNASGMR
jgi:putative DNA primase/helicase